MSDEQQDRNDTGILGRAKRLANQVGDYARSEDAKEKLDAVKKNAVKVGGMASAGAKKIVEGTKEAASQAKQQADEFSKSEKVQVAKAKAKEDWDEIRGGNFRGSKLSDSPFVVGLAIFLFFPLGLYLLWKHPVLGRNKKWWWIGGIWSFLIFMAAVNGDKDKKNPAGNPATSQVATNRSSGIKEAVRETAGSDAGESVEGEEVDRTPVASKGSSARTRKPKPEKIKKGINLENYERISNGMTRGEVEAMLGKGRELASSDDAKAIVYETKNLITGSEKFIEVHYLDGRVTVKYKDGF